MKKFISDLHFDHTAMLYGMDRRPFKDVDEMNEHMIRRWNDGVRKNDEVYVLGDLSFGNGERTNGFLERLNGRIFLIEGNHDRKFLGDPLFNRNRLEWIKPYHEISFLRRKIILSHYPIICYNGQYRKNDAGVPKTFMMYGHVHDTQDAELVDSFVAQARGSVFVPARRTEPENIPCNMINCFCMFCDYMPLSLDEWIILNEKRMATRQP